MQKVAQKRESRLRKLLTTDLGDYFEGKGFEKSSPEFAQVIQEMNDADERVRAIATGDGEESLKDLLKSIKSNINRREYMKAISILGRFHKKMYDINLILSLFAKNIDKTHEKFLFHGLDDETQTHLKSFKDKWASDHSYFIKQANILDFFHNLTSERGRALAGWEKRYPQKVKKIRDGAVSALVSAEKMLNVLLSNLKLMDKARTIRNPDNYIIASKKIMDHFKSPYDRDFKNFYDAEIKGLLEQQDWFKPVVPGVPGTGSIVTSPVAPGTAPVDMSKTIQTPIPAIIPATPPVPQKPLPPQYEKKVDPDTGEVTYIDKNTRKEVTIDQIYPATKPPFDPAARVIDAPTPQARVAPPPLPKLRVGAQHEQFYQSLETLAGEAPIVLVSHIIKYAKSILGSDPETGIKLLKIASDIKGK